jgi:hypothetical protein
MSKKKNSLVIDATDHTTKGGLLNRRLFLSSAIATSAALATTRAAYGQGVVGEGQEDWVLFPGSDALEYSNRSRFEVDSVKRLLPNDSQEFLDLRLTKFVARSLTRDVQITRRTRRKLKMSNVPDSNARWVVSKN